MGRRSKREAAEAIAADEDTASESAGRSRAASKAAKQAARGADKAKKAAKKAAEKAAGQTGRSVKKAAKAAKKAERSVTHAERAAKKAERRADAVVAQAGRAIAPVRAAKALSDPKLAKRLVTVGKILAPALAPVLLKAAAGTRGYLDNQRAQRLGVPVADLGAYRGPTGAMGARINGLTDSIRDLGLRRGKDLQVTRFAEVAAARLSDLTAAVQASATMPRARRAEVLREVGRELDRIDADLVSHLMSHG